MKKENTRREFIKRSAQIAGAGLLSTGLLGCNVLLDDTAGGGLTIRIGHTTLYWTNSTALTLNKSTINGAGSQTILDRTAALGTGPSVNGIAVCPSIGKIYWTETDNGAYITFLKRSNLDGSGIETLYTGSISSPFFTGIAVDVPGGKVYWAESTSLGILVANLDGTSSSVLPTGVGTVNDVALDAKAGKMYFTDGNGGAIMQANLDGTGSVALPLATNTPIAIALDLDGGKVYWTSNGSSNQVSRANLDGSGTVDVLESSGSITFLGIALDSQAGKVYWVEGGTTIRRANMDSTGTGKETLLSGSGFNRLDLG
ncbi:MAG: hypothetical protein IEMM0008_1188 [bacterium]|nr:MAG: hypothetical protein IEMM0008_1188 [bacterium]